MDGLFKQLYLPGLREEQKLAPSFSQTMSAAFGLENDLVNLYDYMTKPTFEADPAFDFQTTFNEAGLPVDWLPILAPSTSRAEFDAKLGRVQDEYKKKAVLAASGWGGTVAAMGAGMLSPTMFIPFSGQARGGMRIAQMLGLAAAGSTAQNAALFLNQETRTEAELYTGIALDTLLMGMMGGAYLGLTKAGRVSLKANVQFNQNMLEVPAGPADMGGQAASTVRLESPDFPSNAAAGMSDGVAKKSAEDFDAEIRRYGKASDGVDNLSLAKPELYDLLSAAKSPFGLDIEPALNLISRANAIGRSDIAESFVEKLERQADRAETAQPGVDADNPRYEDIKVSLQKKAITDREDAKEARQAFENSRQELSAAEPDTEFDPTKVDEVGMAAPRGERPISNPSTAEAQGVGAASVRSRNTRGAKAAPNRARQAALDTLGKMSPAYRMLTQPFFPSLRNAVAKMDMAGIQQAGLDVMEPSAKGGTVIERIRGYDYFLVKFAKTLDENFYRYTHGTTEGFDFGSPAITQMKSQIGAGVPGKMNWAEYKEAVFDGWNSGNIKPEVADSAKAFGEFFKNYTERQKQYLAEMREQGLDVKPLFKELLEDELGEGVANYAHHIFDQQTLMAKSSEFIDEFSESFEKQLTESWGRAKVRYTKKLAKLQYEQAVAKLTPEQTSAQLADVENDIELIEELPEWQALRTERLAITRQAKDEGWSKERLKQDLKDLQERQSDDVKALQEQRKQLMAAAKVLKNFGGDAAEKTAKLQEALEKSDELISNMFREVMPGIEQADISIASIQAKGDKAMKIVQVGIDKTVKELQKRTARLEKLMGSKRANSLTQEKVAEQIDRSKARQALMLERLETTKNQQVALDQRLSELQLLREDAIADATNVVKARSARSADLEDKIEKTAAKIVSPEERLRMEAQIGDEMEGLDADFRMLWGKRGEQSGDPLTTDKPDFFERAREMATLLHQKLTNTEVELSPAYHALRQDARGAELLRVMKLPYDMKKKWLVKDVELVTRAYDRTMAPDLEIWRAFDGSVNAKSVLGEMQDELTGHLLRIGTAKYVKLPKGWVDKAAKFSERVKTRLEGLGEADDLYLGSNNFSDQPGAGFVEISPELRTQLTQSVVDASKASTRDLDVAIQRLRYQRGVPKDASSYWWRAGRLVKALNVLTMMGGVVTSSIADIARPIWEHGAGKVFNKGWKPFVDRLSSEGKKFNIRSKDINRRIGLNLEPVLHGRAQMVFDLADESIGKTRLERGITLGAQKMGLVALYDFWTAAMKTISGNVAHATMSEYVPRVAEAMLDGKAFDGDLLQMRTYLRNLGLSDLDIQRINMQMQLPDGVERFSNGGVLPNLDKWDDPAAYQAYQAAVLTEVNKLIVTPGLERPNVVDENMGYSMLFQFKSFVFGSNSRMAMSGLQGNDPHLMQGIAFSLAFGALSYYTYAITAGGKTLEKANERNPEQWLWESVKRSGILGAMSIPGDIGAAVPAISGAETPDMFRKPSGLLGTVLGPTYSQLDKMAEFLTKMDSDDPKQQERNMRILRQVWVPYQNHFLLRQAFDRAGEALYGAE